MNNKDTYNGIIISLLIVVPIIIYLERKKSVSNIISNKISGGRKLVIGDSHAVGIGKKTKSAEVDSKIAKGGWRVSDLYNALTNYPVTEDVGTIVISIGTNGLYSSSDKVEDLINLVNQKFPNANIYAFKGSYGWSGSLSNSVLLSRQNAYYDRMKNAGVTILNNGLGYFSDGGDAHSTGTTQALNIIKEIESLP